MRARCSEYPNDNPALHDGAIWSCEHPLAAPSCERVEPALPVAHEQGLSRVVSEAMDSCYPARALDEGPTAPTPPVEVVDDAPDDIEIVDELLFDDAIDESPVPTAPLAEAPPAAEAACDPFLVFATVVQDVARGAGADDGAMEVLATLLGQRRAAAGAPPERERVREQAAAWQAILRGECEDFDACGGQMLDEWAAAVVATVLGSPSRADAVKRELRCRGVAAFGLVDRAA